MEIAVRRLKKRKASGPDNLMAEHLLEGGDKEECHLLQMLSLQFTGSDYKVSER